MFIVVFCILVILFLYVSKFIAKFIAPFLLLLGVFCDSFFTNKILRASGYVFNLMAVIGIIIFNVILAYKLTPEILEYIK